MEITNITNTDSTGFTNQDYTSQDGELLNSLIVNQELTRMFDCFVVFKIDITNAQD